MNAIDNEKDPFEDIFRDTFSDFESEPDALLWEKIEPQLPVTPTRKLPYWQFASVAIVLLLAGLSLYVVSSMKNQHDIPSIEKAEKENHTVPQSAQEKTTPNESKAVEDLSTSKNNEVLEESNSADNSTHEIRTESNKAIILTEKSTLKPSKERTNSTTERQQQHQTVLSKNSQKFFGGGGNKTPRGDVFSPNERVNNETFSGVRNENTGQTQENNNVSSQHFVSALQPKLFHPYLNHFKSPKIRYRGPKPTAYYKEPKPVEFYASAMPLINYYTITPNGNDANYVHKIVVNDDADRLGVYAQAGLVFTLSDRLKLRTGLTFTKTNHSFNYQVRTDSLVVQSSDNGNADASFVEVSKVYAQSANYLGTKVELQYTFLKGESLSHYINVGVEGAYRLSGGQALNGFANIAYGITRQIGDNAFLFIEPTYSYSLNQQSDSNSLLLIKPNKIGFNIGINFKLK
ncbi:hypothetical protein [Arcicella rigui]|uniref:Outer membrane protein beta-barrel domain-containing protein n=1 Tax=Arcicella rigui TaxID=797020 RepID=A0ABU5QC58_9BACT|nr:hypothetical protein [Arcicella rigui]MEA5139944.1 hypothetical protein [Arcicella rigui]